MSTFFEKVKSFFNYIGRWCGYTKAVELPPVVPPPVVSAAVAAPSARAREPRRIEVRAAGSVGPQPRRRGLIVRILYNGLFDCVNSMLSDGSSDENSNFPCCILEWIIVPEIKYNRILDCFIKFIENCGSTQEKIKARRNITDKHMMQRSASQNASAAVTSVGVVAGAIDIKEASESETALLLQWKNRPPSVKAAALSSKAALLERTRP